MPLRSDDDPRASIDVPAHARAALVSVLDPELGISIVDLGLVDRIEHTRDASGRDGLVVAILPTSPACPLRETLFEDVGTALGAAFPGASIEIVEAVGPWGPERMSDAARLALGWDAR